MAKKLLLIGIDGATFHFILPFVKSGELKNLKKFMDNGVWGTLNSIVPPISITAWQCLCKGKNPGKLGIYDYVMIEQDSKKTKLFSWASGDNIWDYLGRNGVKSVIFNVPGTYPPKLINGIFISGALTPAGSSDFAIPSQLVKEIRKIVPNYGPELVEGNVIRNKFDFIPEMTKDLANKDKILKYLIRNKKWDFFFFVILSIDTIQHFFWDDKEVILRFYKKIDETIGEITEGLKDTNIIIISDHGQGKINKVINMNAWLREKGYQKMKKEIIPISDVLSKAGITRRNLLLLFSKLGLTSLIKKIPRTLRRKIPQDVITVTTEDALENNLIDWGHTFAVSYGNTNNCIILNRGKLSNRDFVKRRDELLHDLRKFNEKESLGLKIVTKRELYKGDKVDLMPDILLIYKNDDCILFSNNVMGNEIFTKSPGWVSNHSLDGMIIAYGPDIAKSKINDAELIDIVPTVLNNFGIKKPSSVDGKILKIFK